MDGYVTIGTKLDTKGLEQDLKQAQKQLTQFQKEEEKLLKEKGKVDVKLSGYEEEKAKIQANTDELLKSAETEGQVNNLLEIENQELDKLNKKYSQQFTELDNINQKLKTNKNNQGLITNEIEKTNTKLRKNESLDKIGGSLKNVNDGLKKTVKHVIRWGLAIFSVRSAYNMVRQASSTLAQYDKQYATNLEYIRYVLAQTIAPVLQYLVSLAMKLLSYINYIANAWFGVNLFSRASAKNFNKMAGSAEKIKKSLQTAGFDEMNILQDTSSGGGGGGGAVGPSMDLSQMQAEVPEWIKWIAEHRDEILAVIAGVTAGLIAWSFHLGAMKSLGIGLAVAGIVLAIQGLIEYLKDPSFTNFGKIIQGIGLAIIGLGGIIWGLPAIVVGAVVLIVGTIIKYWEQIKGFIQGGIDWLKGKSEIIHSKCGDFIGGIYDLFVNNLQSTLDFFDKTFKAIKGIFDGIIKFIKLVFTGDWKGAWQMIFNIFNNICSNIQNAIWTVLKKVSSMVVNVGRAVGDIIAGTFKAVVNAVLGTIERVLNTPINAVNGLLDKVNTLPGVNLTKLSTFNLPRLAVGGIVNYPGRGVPIGGAITGERGAEGVIPLTDSQAMETLGEAIGKYITINANITNTMNGRVISRQLQKIQSDANFAYNS